MKDDAIKVRQNIFQQRTWRWLPQGISSLLSIIVAFLLGSLAIAVSGSNPITAYKLLIQGAFGSTYGIFETLLRATPLLIAGIGLSISFRGNLTSIGAEGQIILGAIFSAAAGTALPSFIPAVLRIILCMLAGFIGGGLFALLPAFLKARFGTSEIIVTIMLNYVAISLLSYLLDGPMRETGSFYPQGPELPREIWLPQLSSTPGMRLHVGLFIALFSVIAYYIFMFRLPVGFRIRTVGLNKGTAEYAGIHVSRNIMLAMLLSGGLAGLAGAGEIFGIHHKLFNGFATGFGYDALAVALLGRLSPIGVLVSAIFFAALKVGSGTMQRAAQIPTTIVYVIQGLLIMFIFTDKLFLGWINKGVRAWKSRGGSLAIVEEEE